MLAALVEEALLQTVALVVEAVRLLALLRLVMLIQGQVARAAAAMLAAHELVAEAALAS